ncbi:Uncharacterised protein [uncultured archaeon]|nr:Uncharacterised protein [uncultured archaeon]
MDNELDNQFYIGDIVKIKNDLTGEWFHIVQPITIRFTDSNDLISSSQMFQLSNRFDYSYFRSANDLQKVSDEELLAGWLLD